MPILGKAYNFKFPVVIFFFKWWRNSTEIYGILEPQKVSDCHMAMTLSQKDINQLRRL